MSSDSEVSVVEAQFDDQYVLNAYSSKKMGEFKDDIDTEPSIISSISRYFNDVVDDLCFHCGLPGHISKSCPEKTNLPCFLCGERGHTRSSCPQDCCYNCGRPGHVSRECREPKRRRFTNEACHNCGLGGHLQADCPLHWRQYIFVDQLSRDTFYNKLRHIQKYCYHCALKGHFGDECSYKTQPGFSAFHSPIYKVFSLSRSSAINSDKPRSHFQRGHHQGTKKSYTGGYRRQ